MRPIAIVTGSSRGIGQAVVGELLARGVDVLGVARSAPDDFGRGGAAAAYEHVTLDLGDVRAVEAAFADLGARLAGRPRVCLVNNAARLDIGPQTDLSLAAIVATLRVDVAVPMWLAARVVGSAPPSAVIRILDVSSGAASRPVAGWSTYCASKAALDMAGQVLAAELESLPGLAGRDAAVCSFAPGVVATAMQADLRAAGAERFPEHARFVELHATGRLLDPAAPAVGIADWLLDARGRPRDRFTRSRHVAS